AAVAEHVVAARFDLLDDLRIVVADAAVEQDGGRQLQLVENFEQPPVSDAIAVVAPSEVARGLLAGVVRVHPDPGAEREMLDVEGDVERELLAAGPGIVRPLDDRRIVIAGMARKLQHRSSPRSVERIAACATPARQATCRVQNSNCQAATLWRSGA